MRYKSGCCRMLLAGTHHEQLTYSTFRLFPEWESVPKLPITFLNAMNQLTDDDLLYLTRAGCSQLLRFASTEIKTRVYNPCPWGCSEHPRRLVPPALHRSTFSFHSERAHGLKTWMPRQSKLNIYFLLKHLNEKIKPCFTYNRKTKSNRQRSGLAGT